MNVKRAFALEIEGTSIAGVRPAIIVSTGASGGAGHPDECSGLMSLSGFTYSGSAFYDNFLLFLATMLRSWGVSLVKCRQ